MTVNAGLILALLALVMIVIIVAGIGISLIVYSVSLIRRWLSEKRRLDQVRRNTENRGGHFDD